MSTTPRRRSAPRGTQHLGYQHTCLCGLSETTADRERPMGWCILELSVRRDALTPIELGSVLLCPGCTETERARFAIILEPA